MRIQLAVLASGGGSMVDLDATIAIQLGVFLFMLLVLRKLLFQPVIRLIEARREATDGALEAARVLDEEAEALNRKIAAEIDGVRVSAGAERDQMVDEARAGEREMIYRARNEAHDMVTKMRAETETVAAETRRRLAGDVDAIAAMVAAKALDRKL
jgi:F-type H+-transporting ATPase subunit b